MFRFFENLVDPYTDHDEADVPPNRLWPFLRSYSQPFRKVFFLTALMSVIVAAIEVWLIYYMGRVVNLLSSGGPSEVWSTYGTELILVAVFLLVIRPLIQGLDVALLNNAVLPNFGTLIRWRAHGHVLRQSVGWFENDFAGRIANRIMQTPPAAGEAIFQIFDAITFSIAYVIGAVILLSETDPRLALPLLIWLALYGYLVLWTVRRVGPASKASSDARSQFTGRVVDSYTNIHSVKMFANHRRELEYARDSIEYSRETFIKEMRIFTRMDIALTVINGLLIVGLVGYAIYLWSGGSMTVGAIAAAITLALRLNAMTGWIMWALTSFFQNLGIVSEGMETIAQPITLTDKPDARPLKFSSGQIRFDDVTHHYGREAGGIQAINLTIAPGEKVGLVGRSGAGKSTLIKLLLRFYDPDSGRVLIDDQDIADVTQDSLRQYVGMVSQDSSLLHRSVRDNIRYGKPGATEEEIVAAARKAEIHEFVETLEDPQGRRGYDAHVGERGVKLSGGQRQRVALARVILKDAPILVLDEATSALDSEVEAEIQKTLYGVMEGKTVIAIAHRLSTIAHMDRIIVLDGGKIAEQGSHDALLARGGLYSRFWGRQSGGMLGTAPAAE